MIGKRQIKQLTDLLLIDFDYLQPGDFIKIFPEAKFAYDVKLRNHIALLEEKAKIRKRATEIFIKSDTGNLRRHFDCLKPEEQIKWIKIAESEIDE